MPLLRTAPTSARPALLPTLLSSLLRPFKAVAHPAVSGMPLRFTRSLRGLVIAAGATLVATGPAQAAGFDNLTRLADNDFWEM